MVNEEILTALENAIARNEDLQEAAETLINAGYSEKDVAEVKDYLQGEILSAESEGRIIGQRIPDESDEIKGIKKPKKSFFSGIKKLFKRKKIPKPYKLPEPVPPVSPSDSDIENVTKSEPQKLSNSASTEAPIETLKQLPRTTSRPKQIQPKPLPKETPYPIQQSPNKTNLLLIILIILIMISILIVGFILFFF